MGILRPWYGRPAHELGQPLQGTRDRIAFNVSSDTSPRWLMKFSRVTRTSQSQTATDLLRRPVSARPDGSHLSGTWLSGKGSRRVVDIATAVIASRGPRASSTITAGRVLGICP